MRNGFVFVGWIFYEERWKGKSGKVMEGDRLNMDTAYAQAVITQ
jgi:hypothetical protein